MLISTQLSHIHRCKGKKAEFKIKIIENKGRHLQCSNGFLKTILLEFQTCAESPVFQEESSHDFDLTFRHFSFCLKLSLSSKRLCYSFDTLLSFWGVPF